MEEGHPHSPRYTCQKHDSSAPANPKIVGRNSSLELLRIIAMLMIVSYHFIYINPDHELLLTQGPCIRFVYEVLLIGGGWVGNFIFFTISTWFLLDRETTLLKSFRRIWILERELLFWSVTLLVIYLILHAHSPYVEPISMGSTRKLILTSIFPLISNLWWYPTSYALYLLFLPFLIKGTKALGATSHRNLAILCLMLWGIGGLLPNISFNLTEASVFVFIYWFILISYYRWYMRPFSEKACIGLIAGGIAINIFYWSTFIAFSSITGKGSGFIEFIFDHWKLPSMMIGFGLFLLFERRRFFNPIINWIAGSTFGIFLIHYHPISRKIWGSYLPLRECLTSPNPVLQAMACIAAIFLCCLLLDMVRQAFFALTIDKHKGAVFDKLCVYVGKRIKTGNGRHMQDKMAHDAIVKLS